MLKIIWSRKRKGFGLELDWVVMITSCIFHYFNRLFTLKQTTTTSSKENKLFFKGWLFNFYEMYISGSNFHKVLDQWANFLAVLNYVFYVKNKTLHRNFDAFSIYFLTKGHFYISCQNGWFVRKCMRMFSDCKNKFFKGKLLTDGSFIWFNSIILLGWIFYFLSDKPICCYKSTSRN
jgi:hypothetical protein